MATARRKDGSEVAAGDELTSFRGERAKFISAETSRGEGKVTVRWLSGRETGYTGTYYAGVFGLPPITE